MLPWLIVVVAVVGLGIALASVAERSAVRWRALLRELLPDGRLSGRRLTTMVAEGHAIVTTPLTPSGIAYQAAARVLSRGPLLAMLYELSAEASESELRAKLPLARVGPATIRAQLIAFAALADALEALPLAEAMTRRFVDLSSDTASHERLAALQAMIQWHPRAPEVIAACRSEVAHGDDVTIVDAARAHLANMTNSLANMPPSVVNVAANRPGRVSRSP